MALYLDDPLSDRAGELVRRLAADGAELHAPDLLTLEVASALVKAARRGELSTEQCLERVTAVSESEIELHGGRRLAPAATSLALAHGLSVYDATYLALAIALGARLATGDRRFAHRVRAAGVEIELASAST